MLVTHTDSVLSLDDLRLCDMPNGVAARIARTLTMFVLCMHVVAFKLKLNHLHSLKMAELRWVRSFR